MHIKTVLILAVAISLVAGCSSSATGPGQKAAAGEPAVAAAPTQPGSTAPDPAGLDKGACALLTKADVEKVQGDKMEGSTGSEERTGALAISRCLFRTADYSRSVSLEVVRRDSGGGGGEGPRQFWESKFPRPAARGREREEERERERERPGEKEEEEEGRPPLRVKGIGAEAFWVGSRVTGALYVLKGESYIRISVGGPGDEATKIRKAKTLARMALRRLLP